MFRGKWNLSVSVKKEQLPNVRRGNKYGLHKIRHSQILTTRSSPILQKKKKIVQENRFCPWSISFYFAIWSRTRYNSSSSRRCLWSGRHSEDKRQYELWPQPSRSLDLAYRKSTWRLGRNKAIYTGVWISRFKIHWGTGSITPVWPSVLREGNYPRTGGSQPCGCLHLSSFSWGDTEQGPVEARYAAHIPQGTTHTPHTKRTSVQNVNSTEPMTSLIYQHKRPRPSPGCEMKGNKPTLWTNGNKI